MSFYYDGNFSNFLPASSFDFNAGGKILVGLYKSCHVHESCSHLLEVTDYEFYECTREVQQMHAMECNNSITMALEILSNKSGSRSFSV